MSNIDDVLRGLGKIEGTVETIVKDLSDHRVEVREDFKTVHDRVSKQGEAIQAISTGQAVRNGIAKQRKRNLSIGLTIISGSIGTAVIGVLYWLFKTFPTIGAG